MRIIPVIDLRGRLAVRGRAGDRRHYAPVRSRIAPDQDGDLSNPERLLEAYLTVLRPDTIYVADLDRIEQSGDNDEILGRLRAAAPEVRILWDGGMSSASAQRPLLGDRVVPVLGTETLRSIDDLRPGAPFVTGPLPVLSLDLIAEGVVTRSAGLKSLDEAEILIRALHLGVRTAIVLTLDRIGTSAGLARDRLRRLRRMAPDLELLAGGGIGSIDDLSCLRDAGYAGALLATALHEGRITPEELQREGFLGVKPG